MIQFDSQDQAEPYKWDHTHWFGGLGLNVSHRFTKDFEIGGEVIVSLTQSYFPNLIAGETVGTLISR